LLEAIATQIEALGDALIQRAHAETALPLARLQGERGRTCGQLRLFAEVVRNGSWADVRIEPALPARQPLPRPELRRALIPLGPVVVFGSSNFPLAFSVAGGDTASALAAGCPVVVKAHPAHPGTSELVAGAIIAALKQCGLPAGIFSLLHGGRAVGEALVKHPAVTAVGFTGSYGAGKALMTAAASRARPIPVFAEMSSLNPVFLLPAALQTKNAEIAQGLLTSITMGVGQFCTKPGLVFVQRGPEADTFLATLGNLIKAAPCGTLLTRGIQRSFVEHRDRVLAVPGVKTGANAAVLPTQQKTEAQPGFAVTRSDIFLKHPEIATEVFGPFTVVVVAETTEELLACARALDGQLTATLHATEADKELTESLLEIVTQKAGRIVFNGFPTGVEVSATMNHGGPWPASSDVRFTSVGTAAILRFARPICYQNCPQDLLPDLLRDKPGA
jgi:NADP-dependent aldehyde dehydrogenase